MPLTTQESLVGWTPTGRQRCRKGEGGGEEVLPDIELIWPWMEPVRKEGNNLPALLAPQPQPYLTLWIISTQRSEGFLGSERQLNLQAGEGGNSREQWYRRRLLRVQGTARRSNQSVLKEINGRTDAEAEAPIFWPPDAKSRLIGKDPDAGKDWRQEKEATEDEMVGWHHWLNGSAFEQTLGDSEGQEALACCSPWHWK